MQQPTAQHQLTELALLATLQGKEKPYMMWTLVGMVPNWELGFNLVVSVFAGEFAYGP